MYKGWRASDAVAPEDGQGKLSRVSYHDTISARTAQSGLIRPEATIHYFPSLSLKCFMPQTRAILSLSFLVVSLMATSCDRANGPSPAGATPPPRPLADADATSISQDAPTLEPSPTETPTPEPSPTETATLEPAAPPESGATPTQASTLNLDITVSWEDATAELRYMGWKTDFTKYSAPYSEIKRGGPPRDGIPPIDSPSFESASEASTYLAEHEPVLSVEIGEEARAYPLAVLIWHEIVNDEVGGVPISVTYCPLCNTAIVFDRRVGADERVLDFGTTGNLRNSDLIMWDRQTQSWWQQITGDAIVGEYTGTKLELLPGTLVSWRDFRDSFPDGRVLSRDTGFSRDYSRPPYAGYDSGDGRPFMFVGELDGRLPPMERVIGLKVGDTAVAYPFTLFDSSPVINDRIEGQDIAIFYAPDTLSAFLGEFGSESPVVGSTGVYDPNTDGRKLTYRREEGSIVDYQTGSEWNIFGKATGGSLEGSVLSPIIHANHFWFAWSVFNPDTLIRRPGEFQNQSEKEKTN